MMILYGSENSFYTPSVSNQTVMWQQLLGITNTQESLSMISTEISPYKSMSYFTPFYLKYGTYYIGLDSEYKMRIFNDSIQNLLTKDNTYMTFLLEPRFDRYACENKECVKIDNDKSEKIIYRRSNCNDKC